MRTANASRVPCSAPTAVARASAVVCASGHAPRVTSGWLLPSRDPVVVLLSRADAAEHRLRKVAYMPEAARRAAVLTQMSVQSPRMRLRGLSGPMGTLAGLAKSAGVGLPL